MSDVPIASDCHRIAIGLPSAQAVEINKSSDSVIVALAMALCIDYGLFLGSRTQTELEAGHSLGAAIGIALRYSGG